MLSLIIETIKSATTEYIGSGMYIALFLVSLLYIFLKEENKNIKIFLGCFSILIIGIVINPIFCKLVEKVFTKSVYWRLFWMLPIGIVLAYICAKIVNHQEKKIYKILVALSLLFIIMISGKFIYTKENYIKVGNAYKLPDEAVHIAYILEQEDKQYKKVMLPTSLVPYIRQINGNINLMYPRKPRGYAGIEIVQRHEAGDVEYVANKCKEENCNYIIFNKQTVLTKSLSDYEYELFEQTENYDLYRLKY